MALTVEWRQIEEVNMLAAEGTRHVLRSRGVGVVKRTKVAAVTQADQRRPQRWRSGRLSWSDPGKANKSGAPQPEPEPNRMRVGRGRLVGCRCSSASAIVHVGKGSLASMAGDDNSGEAV